MKAMVRVFFRYWSGKTLARHWFNGGSSETASSRLFADAFVCCRRPMLRMTWIPRPIVVTRFPVFGFFCLIGLSWTFRTHSPAN